MMQTNIPVIKKEIVLSNSALRGATKICIQFPFDIKELIQIFNDLLDKYKIDNTEENRDHLKRYIDFLFDFDKPFEVEGYVSFNLAEPKNSAIVEKLELSENLIKKINDENLRYSSQMVAKYYTKKLLKVLIREDKFSLKAFLLLQEMIYNFMGWISMVQYKETLITVDEYVGEFKGLSDFLDLMVDRSSY